MYHQFKAREIFEMAEKIEQNGYNFYRKAAEDVGDPEIGKLLLELATMEVAHELTFVEMKANLTEAESAETVFDPYEETVLYIQALVNTRVFYHKQIDTSSAEEVLKAAIQAEKDSIAFYLGMRDMVPADMGKDKIEDIIKEEMRHIRIISELLLKCKK